MLNNPTVAVVMGSSATALYAIRELGENGVTVFSECDSSSFVKCSRFLSESIIVSDNVELRLNNLIALSKESKVKPVLIPCSDQDVEFVSENSNILSNYFYIQASIVSEVAVAIMDKGKLFDLCRSIDVEMPACWVLTRDELAMFSETIEYPCILKPTLIHMVKNEMRGKKLWTINTELELAEIVSSLPEGNTDWILQELIPGPESEIVLYASYIDHKGDIRQSFTGKKLRQFPPGFGSASLVSSQKVPELEKICSKLFCHAGYRGIVAGEFKRDPRTNKYKMIEVNARPSLWFSLTTVAGKKIVYAAVMDLVHGKTIADGAQNEGVVWRYFLKDLYSKFFYFFRRNFILPSPDVELLRSVNKSIKAHAVFKTDDPKPLIYEIFYLIKKVVNRTLGK